MRKYNKSDIHDFRALARISNDTEMHNNVHVKQETQDVSSSQFLKSSFINFK